jgi:integrase/recombinase XerD
VTALLDKGNQPATARTRQLAVRRFTSWLSEEGELEPDPFLGVKAPKLDTKVTEPLTHDELRLLLRACTPPKGSTPAEMMRHRRDEAILRLMMESGARAGEVVALELDDVDAGAGTATIRRGKGGKGRVGSLRAAHRARHRPLHAVADPSPAR